MARIRYLKPDFFRDEDLAKLPFEYRLLYAGLWCHADKEGRLQNRPKRLKVDIFPYDSVDIEKGLKELAKTKENSSRPFILRYEIEGERYIQILKWHDHQKPHSTEKESEIPSPPLLPPLKSKENGESKSKPTFDADFLSDVKEPLNTRYLVNRIFNFWNRLARHDQKNNTKTFIKTLNLTTKLQSIIETRIKDHAFKVVRQAIWNYRQLLLHPQSKWTYRWGLYDFLTREKDNIARFEDWDMIKYNWLDTSKESKPQEKYLRYGSPEWKASEEKRKQKEKNETVDQ